MNDSKVLLKVEDFRAISQAEIKLDGITVVAGVNGCGKSTLSKLLYWVYRGATDFKVLADIQFRKDLEVVNKLVMLFVQTAQHHFLEEQNNNEITTNNIDIKIQRMSYMTEVISILTDWHDLYRLEGVNQQDFIDFFDTAKQKLNEIGNEPYSAENIIKIFNDIFDEERIEIKETENIFDVNIFDFLTDLTNTIFDEHKKIHQ
ncbi:AAA family ATPase [Moraxella nonliquefaciens]|uniref:AAA family ATPase n=1 Tax=Moraxella nonliquefaciens TaxID=478 RepID=UPI000A405902|nr:AAA family ATPase [Moraxella nonliquefaciens]